MKFKFKFKVGDRVIYITGDNAVIVGFEERFLKYKMKFVGEDCVHSVDYSDVKIDEGYYRDEKLKELGI